MSFCKGSDVKAKVRMKTLGLQRKHEGSSITHASVALFEAGRNRTAGHKGFTFTRVLDYESDR